MTVLNKFNKIIKQIITFKKPFFTLVNLNRIGWSISPDYTKGGFIDSWGRGTLKIYDACKEAELPEPEIKEFQGGFLVTLFKDNLTEDQLAKLGLNDRQLKAVNFVREKGKITNKEYQELNETSDRTALRDLENLTELNIFVKDGEKKGTSYKLKFGG
jgi:ATP-dependent DNA helicase RecG